MNPCEMNMAIASISNYLYCNMDEEDFECLALFLNELSKSMFAMSIHERLCKNHKKPHDHADGKDVAAAAVISGSGLAEAAVVAEAVADAEQPD